jgi:glycosyltransferase involved in cell wall biosynthesis
VVMLVSNACAPDRRVLREAQALAARGHYVKVIAWDREGTYPARETVTSVEIERVAVPSAYGSGLKRLRQWPAFVREAYARVREAEWHAVHCHDLDTLPIGYVCARRYGLPLIFDAHESFPDLAAPRLPGWSVALLRLLESALIRRVDALITVGDLLAGHYRRWARRVVVVRNCQPAEGEAADPSALRQGWQLGTVQLVACYIGGFTMGRVILPLVDAVKANPLFGLVLVGDGPQLHTVLQAAEGIDRIAYLGPRVPPARVVDIMRAADVVYYGLRSDFPNNRFSSPNTLYAALAAGRPLVTTDVGEISHVVREEECGLIVAEPTEQAIGLALAELEDPIVRATLAQRAQRAGDIKYNWPLAEAELLKLYQELWGEV